MALDIVKLIELPKVVDFRAAEKKISLSMKALEAAPAPAEEAPVEE